MAPCLTVWPQMELDPTTYALYARIRRPQKPPEKGFVHIDEWLTYIKEALEWTPTPAPTVAT